MELNNTHSTVHQSQKKTSKQMVQLNCNFQDSDDSVPVCVFIGRNKMQVTFNWDTCTSWHDLRDYEVQEVGGGIL
jgi:hypothetical protein